MAWEFVLRLAQTGVSVLLEAGTLSYEGEYTSTVTSLSREKLGWPVCSLCRGGIPSLVSGRADFVIRVCSRGNNWSNILRDLVRGLECWGEISKSRSRRIFSSGFIWNELARPWMRRGTRLWNSALVENNSGAWLD